MSLSFKQLTGPFNRQNLRKVPASACPTTASAYKIEKILKFKDIDNVPSALVQFENLPDSMNAWLPTKNLVFTE
jgi:hypothetical protein